MEQQQMDPGQVNVKHRFTPDELRALRECNRESFYYRCLPIGTSMTVATYFAVKNGYLKASPRFGATPKMLAAAICGYFIGKFSYQAACLDKLMAVPNSELAQQLRQRRGLPSLAGDWGSSGEGSGGFSSFPSFGPSTAADTAPSEFSSQNFTDVGDTRPLDSFDAGVAPTSRNDLVMEEDIPIQPATKTTTYDELTRANRDDFYRGKSSAPAPAPKPAAREERSGPVGTGMGGGGSGKPGVRNKYGDVWEGTD